MLGACGDHGLLGDGDSGIGCEDLVFLLFPSVDGKGEARVNAAMEIGHVVIQIKLADLGIGSEDVYEERAEIDGIKTFSGVVKDGVVDMVDCHHELVTRDGVDHLVGVPCLACGGIGGTQLFAFGCCGAGWDDWVG